MVNFYKPGHILLTCEAMPIIRDMVHQYSNKARVGSDKMKGGQYHIMQTVCGKNLFVVARCNWNVQANFCSCVIHTPY